MLSEAEIAAVKARPENAVPDIAARYVTLRRRGGRFVGPCPMHSRDPAARDSTAFECWDDAGGGGWVCAVCSDGGDALALVMRREGCGFEDAIARLGGAAAVDPEEARRAEEARAERRAAAEAEAAGFRERERARAWDILHYGRPIAGTPVERYLREARGLDAPPALRLRYDAVARLWADGGRDAGGGKRPPRLVHRGPAMLAAIQRGGRFAGVHMTFLDLAQPKGKARIVDPLTGEGLPAKKVRGSKRGGHIDLLGPPPGGLATLVLGEGVEKVLAAWTALARCGRDLSRTGFWVSVDLGNLGGRAAATVPHPSLVTPAGRPARVPGPEPDLDAPATATPDSVERLVLLGDTTSDDFLTRCALARAAARYAWPGRAIVAAWPPAGLDFDDVLRAAA